MSSTLDPSTIGEELRLNDFITVIMQFLDLTNLINSRQVCRRWWCYVHELLMDDFILFTAVTNGGFLPSSSISWRIRDTIPLLTKTPTREVPWLLLGLGVALADIVQNSEKKNVFNVYLTKPEVIREAAMTEKQRKRTAEEPEGKYEPRKLFFDAASSEGVGFPRALPTAMVSTIKQYSVVHYGSDHEQKIHDKKIKNFLNAFRYLLALHVKKNNLFGTTEEKVQEMVHDMVLQRSSSSMTGSKSAEIVFSKKGEKVAPQENVEVAKESKEKKEVYTASMLEMWRSVKSLSQTTAKSFLSPEFSTRLQLNAVERGALFLKVDTSPWCVAILPQVLPIVI